jgi:thiamine-monophosphate kinase
MQAGRHAVWLPQGKIELFRTENEFVRWLRAKTASRGRGLRLGIGDDAALVSVRHGYELLLKSDMSIEGVHFQTGIHLPRSVGHRALARSLSDIAAMGGRPRFALTALALSKGCTRAWLESFYAGLLDLAKRCGVVVIGGDTAVVPGATVIDVIVTGEVEPGRALRRSGARPGDAIYVSGWLGASALGLELLKEQPRLSRAVEIAPRGTSTGRALGARFTREHALRAHLYPEPRIALGRLLLEQNLASAAIDVSDGLSTDLGRLAEASRVGARLREELVPKAELPESRRANWLALALHGGEDYELLFTVPTAKVSRVPRVFRGVALHRLGEITKSKGLRLVQRDGREHELRPAGYDHFRTE